MEDKTKDATPPVLPRPQNVWQSIEQMTEILAREGIAKNKGGSGDIKYKFRGIDDIRNNTSPLMKECALVIIPKVTKREEQERTTKSGAFALWVVLHIDFELVNTVDTTSKTVVPMIAEAVDYSDKATQKAISQGYKTFAINVFNIPTEGEQDGDDEKKEFQAKRTGVFGSDDERTQYVANCKAAFEQQETALSLKDCEGYYHDKLILMGNSKDSEDIKAATDIRAVYGARLKELSKPKSAL